MKIQTSIEDTIAIVEVEGSLSSEEKIAFDREVNGLIERRLNVVLDLSRVTFIDSSTLGSIVKFYTLFRKHDRYLLMASVNRQIFEVMQLTGITKQIQIFESPRSAVDFIRGA